MGIDPRHHFGWFEPSVFADFIKCRTRTFVIQLIKGRFGNTQKFSGLITRPQVVWEVIHFVAHMKNFFLL